MSIDNEFLHRLEKQLGSHGSWPSVYMFKFIIPDNNRDYALLQRLFGDESHLSTRHSKGGKYISVTVKEMMISPEEVITKYREAANIEGIIAL